MRACKLLQFDWFNCLEQFGFRKKHCTVDAIVELTEQNTGNVIKFFLDLRKAFDTIDQFFTIEKIEDLRVA